MQYEMTLYIAEKNINKWMRSGDLKPDLKWYITRQKAFFTPKEKLSPEFFYNIIEKSKDNKDPFIPAIEFCGQIYKDPDVQILSDGKEEMFI